MNSTVADIPMEATDSLGMPAVSACDIFGDEVELLSGLPLPTTEEAAWHHATPEEMFGAQSVAVTERPIIAATRSYLSDTAVFQTSVVVLVIAYMTILLRSSGHVRSIIGAIFHSGGADPSVIEEANGATAARFMGGTMLFGVLLAGIVMVKAVDLTIDAAAAIPSDIRSAAPLLTTAAVIAIAAWQLLLHRAVAWVCRDTDIKRLGNIAYVFFSAGALLLFPLSALMLLGSGYRSSVWVIISALGIAFVCILYLKETFMFFTSKKISILYWFLYLCSVIVLPMSLICLIAADLQ